MNYLDEFRDPQRLQVRLQQVRQLCTRRWTIMDVCGGQTHNLLRCGLEHALSDVVEMIHGPGCPVCVTPAEAIDDAIHLALHEGAILATFGDMLRVPGRTGSLLQARARGGDIRSVHCPCDAVQLAQRYPHRQVVFFAVGFETTVPSTALAVLQAQARQVSNFSVLAHHVRVEPAMRVLLADPACRIHGFLAAGHVCTVTGYQNLLPLAADFQVPIVVTGFEPLDLVEGLIGCIEQLERGIAWVENRYHRWVRPEGNPAARQLIDRVFVVCDALWRGFGLVSEGGFALRSELKGFDARQRLSRPMSHPMATTAADAHCAAVLSGRLKPPQCPLFGTVCTPDCPQGAPMVSSEGACAAYFGYARPREVAHG